MDASEFNRLLNADHYAPADLELVKDVCKNYPAFSLSHMLRVRIMEALSHENEPELKRAAVCAPDRSRLYQMVKESLGKEEEQVEAAEEEEDSGLSFTMESSEEVDVIIDQHAPYAASLSEKDANLLELDEEDTFVLDEEDSEEELSSETLIEAVGRNEAEIEEALTEDPDTEHENTPVIDEPEDEEDAGEVSGIEDPSPEPDPEPSSEQKSLIRNFIMDEPGPIRADKETSIKGDVSLASIREHDGFITDTLAKIYVKQRLFAKAIYAYEKLSLKYPEKSAYFAAQIEKIRNINHS